MNKNAVLTFILVSLYHLSFSQSIDTDFKPRIQGLPLISSHAHQSDGKVLLSGEIYSVGNVSAKSIIRLNSNGTLDASFSSDEFGTNQINHIDSFGDSIVVASSYQGRAWILNGNGETRHFFNNGLGIFLFDKRILVQESGFKLSLYDLNGNAVSSFATSDFNGYIEGLAVSSDEKLILVGGFTTVNDNELNRIVRLNSDGTIDATFQLGTGADGEINTVKIDDLGRIIISGSFSSFNGTSTPNGIIRLNSDGSIDSFFSLSEISNVIDSYVSDIEIVNDSLIVIGRNLAERNEKMFRVTDEGIIDLSFPISSFSPFYFTTSLGKNGDIITVSGGFSSVNNQRIIGFAQLNSNGKILNTDRPVIGSLPRIKGGVVLKDSDDILIYGDFITINGDSAINLARLHSDGSLADFNIGLNTDDVIHKVHLLENGDMLLSGYFRSFGNKKMIRLNNDGSLDNSFSVSIPGSTNEYVDFLVKTIETGYEIIIAGAFTSVNGISKPYLAKIDSTGTLVSSFNPANIVSKDVEVIDALPDGSILIGGYDYSIHNGFFWSLNSEASAINFQIDDFPEGIFTIFTEYEDRILIGGFHNNPPSKIYQVGYDGTLLNENMLVITSGDPVVMDFYAIDKNTFLIGGRFTTFNSVPQQGIIGTSFDGEIQKHFAFDLDGNRSIVEEFIPLDDEYIFAVGNFEGINGNFFSSIAKLKITRTYPQFFGLKNEISIDEDQPFAVSLDTLNFEPGDYDLSSLSVVLMEGENFSIKDSNTIVPDENYFGTISVGAFLDYADGYSDTVNFNIEILSVNDPPIIMGTRTESHIHSGDTLTIKLSDLEVSDPDNVEEDIFLIILDGENYSVISDSSISIANNFAADFVVYLQVSDGESESEVFEYPVNMIVLGAKDVALALKDTVIVYPNPVKEVIKIKAHPAIKLENIQLHTIDGKLIGEFQLSDTDRDINLKKLKSGVYFLKIQTRQKTYFKKIYKE